MNPILEIENVSKRYSKQTLALSNLSLTAGPGLLGLLGPNGAGKSTLMKLLATLIKPDTGNIKLNGIDALTDDLEIRRRIGYLPQDFSFYPSSRPVDLLNHFAILKGINNKQARKGLVEELLMKANLLEHRNKTLGQFSGGMRQRFGLAQALIGQPQLLILDEPTVGLDPEERNRFHNLISSLSSQTIIILSSHLVDDVADLCQRVVILKGGVVQADNHPESLQEGFKGKIWRSDVTRLDSEILNPSITFLTQRVRAGRRETYYYAKAAPGEGFVAAEPTLEHVYFYHLNKIGS